MNRQNGALKDAASSVGCRSEPERKTAAVPEREAQTIYERRCLDTGVKYTMIETTLKEAVKLSEVVSDSTIIQIVIPDVLLEAQAGGSGS